MHPDELPTDAALVRRLLAAQHPQWAGLPIAPVASSGTDHALYRIGDALVARLPRIGWAVGQAAKEYQWLPRLAPYLPLAVPVPVALGEPGEGYPWPWSVCTWLPGADAIDAPPSDWCAAAVGLASFVVALRGVDASGGPPAGDHNFGRGIPLADRDEYTRVRIDQLVGEVDVAAVTAAWDAALATPVWDGPPVWVHGDLNPGNLLVVEGRLGAVIDFGGLGTGDPAVDLLPAWNVLTGDARAAFREAVDVDDATWARGRGWALSVAVVALPYYLDKNAEIVANARATIAAVLADDAGIRNTLRDR